MDLHTVSLEALLAPPPVRWTVAAETAAALGTGLRRVGDMALLLLAGSVKPAADGLRETSDNGDLGDVGGAPATVRVLGRLPTGSASAEVAPVVGTSAGFCARNASAPRACVDPSRTRKPGLLR